MSFVAFATSFEVQSLKKDSDKKPLESVQLTDAKGRTRDVKTCKEYKKAIRGGFAASTTVAMAGESFFIQRCGYLEFLERARPAKESHLRPFEIADASVLPPGMGGIGGDSSYTEKLNKAVASGTSWKGFAPNYEANRLSKTQFALNGDGERIDFDLLALGDFNQDGLDDALLSVSSGATEGTMRIYETYVVTRKPAEKLLRIVAKYEAGKFDSKNSTLTLSYTGCPWEQVQEDRSRIRKLMDVQQFEEGRKELTALKDRCGGSLGSEEALKLLTDLAEAAVKANKLDQCKAVAAEAKKLDAYAWDWLPPAKAMRIQEKLCP